MTFFACYVDDFGNKLSTPVACEADSIEDAIKQFLPLLPHRPGEGMHRFLWPQATSTPFSQP